MTKKELDQLGQIYYVVTEMDKNFAAKQSEIERKIGNKVDLLWQNIDSNNKIFNQLQTDIFKAIKQDKAEIIKALNHIKDIQDTAISQQNKKRHFTIELNTPDNLKSGIIIFLCIMLTLAFVLVFLMEAKINILQGVISA